MPLASVIIPTYNRADYVVEAIESVLHQNFDDYEIIVIDDGSTDDTAVRIKQRFGELEDKKIKYLYHENKERGFSRNRGIRESKGEYVAFLDSDDTWYPFHLSDCINYLENHPEKAMVFSEHNIMNKKEEIFSKSKRRLKEKEDFFQLLLLKKIIIIPSEVIIKKSIFEDIGYFKEELHGSEDWELWVRLALQKEIGHLEHSTIIVRDHGEKFYSNPEKVEKALLDACDVIFSFLPKEKKSLKNKILSQNHVDIAYTYFLNGRMKEARIHLKKALICDKKKLVCSSFLCMYFKTFLGKRLSEIIRSLKRKVQFD